MKVFVVCAVLIASVAARSVELDSLRGDSLLTRRGLLERGDILRGDVYSPRVGLLDETTGLTGLSSLYNRRVSLLSFEEIISTPLFREYFAIPLFRQYFERYPVVFRRYIESPLFQQFWTVPAFMGYFRNPVLFYKYIVPQIQMIQENSGEWDVPTTFGRHTERDVLLREYLNRLFDREGRVPTSTFGRFVPETTFGGRTTHTGVYSRENYAYLLDKIYKTLFTNEPTVGEVTQVRTDVKVAPAKKEVIIEPITGEQRVVVEEPRIVDVKVAERVLPREVVGELPIVERRLVKENILKKLLLHKVITVETYEILKTLPLRTIEEFIRTQQLEGVIIPREILSELVRPEELIYGEGRQYDNILREGRQYDNIFGEGRQYDNILREGRQYDNILREGRQYDNVIRNLVNRDVYGHRYNNIYNNEMYGEGRGVMTPVLRDLVNNVYGRQGERQLVDELVRRV